MLPDSVTTDPPPSPSALAALRAATRDHHDRIEAAMAPQRLRERAHYARVLQAFDAFLGPWETAVVRALPPALRCWAAERSRRAFLAHDLEHLGLEPLDLPVPPLRLDGVASAFGSLYVLEGSALGGQVIVRELAGSGLTPQAGCAWFHGWGEATGARWREFRAAVEVHAGPDAESRAQACAAACTTFDALTALFHSVLHERPAFA